MQETQAEMKCKNCKKSITKFSESGLCNSCVRKGDKSPAWKGKKAGYRSIHLYLDRTWGKTGICERCGKNKGLTDWSNNSGKYLRSDRKDWEELCRSCHKLKDMPADYGIRAQAWLRHAKRHTKAVIQLNLNREVIAEYISIHEASRRTNIQASLIIANLKDRTRTNKGNIWIYK